MNTTYKHWAITAFLGFFLTAFIAGSPVKFLGYGAVYILLSQFTFFVFTALSAFKTTGTKTQFALLTALNLGLATLFML